MKSIARRITADAMAEPDTDKRAALVRDARRAESAHAIAGALTLAGTEAELAVSPEQLDADPFLLNCTNGALDLRTMELGPHEPAELLTKMTRAAYRPDVASAECDKFLAGVQPDEEFRGYLARQRPLAWKGRSRAPAGRPLRRRRQRQNDLLRGGDARGWGLRRACRPGPADRPHVRRAPDRHRRPVRHAAGPAARDRFRAPPGRGHRQAADRRRPDQGPADAGGLLVVHPVPHIRHADQPPAGDRRHRRGNLAAGAAGAVECADPGRRAGRATLATGSSWRPTRSCGSWWTDMPAVARARPG